MNEKLNVTVLMDDATIPVDSPDFLAENLEPTTEYHIVSALRELGHYVRICGVDNKVTPIVHELADHKPDIVFNLAEQFRDERRMDSHLAGLLELMNIPFTGTGSLGLMLCRNKGLCKQLLSARKIRVPHFIVVPQNRKVHVPKAIRFPLVVKPLLEDGSDGITKSSLVKDEKELMDRSRLVHDKFHQSAIAEEYIEGQEIYVGVIGNKRLKVLPPRQIFLPDPNGGGPVLATQRAKFDVEYQKKWNIKFGFAQLDKEIAEKVIRICKRAYRVLQIHDFGRMDIRITPDNLIYILEVNSNPDIAYGEEVAESAEKAGIKYTDLIDRILRMALQRYSKTD
jgi:D-alanine-D-alanine ligase